MPEPSGTAHHLRTVSPEAFQELRDALLERMPGMIITDDVVAGYALAAGLIIAGRSPFTSWPDPGSAIGDRDDVPF